MILAIEDAISEAIAHKVLAVFRPDLSVSIVVGRQGNAHLRRRARDLNLTARAYPVLLLTDLDSPRRCPAALRTEWLGVRHERLMLFRVAVMEVESWVLGDRENIAKYLGVAQHRVPEDVDALPDPKQALINLARLSRSSRIRMDLLPDAGSTAKVGPAYNPAITAFVRDTWSPARAAQHSGSLSKAIGRLRVAF
jgi:hypothetical protein